MPARETPGLVDCVIPLSACAAWIRNEPPGSSYAREQGCTCPTEQPEPRAFVFSFHCPRHILELAP